MGVERRSGEGRKKDEVDVQWNLRPVQSFDRERTGSVALRREKDREGWLPREVTFSIGGNGKGGFLLSRSAGTIENEDEEGLKDSERKTLEALESLGGEGSKVSEWEKRAMELGVSHSSFYRAKPELVRKGRVFPIGKRFLAKGSTGSKEVPRNLMEPTATTRTSIPLISYTANMR